MLTKLNPEKYQLCKCLNYTSTTANICNLCECPRLQHPGSLLRWAEGKLGGLLSALLEIMGMLMLKTWEFWHLFYEEVEQSWRTLYLSQERFKREPERCGGIIKQLPWSSRNYLNKKKNSMNKIEIEFKKNHLKEESQRAWFPLVHIPCLCSVKGPQSALVLCARCRHGVLFESRSYSLLWPI